jgi:hypothetical protein
MCDIVEIKLHMYNLCVLQIIVSRPDQDDFGARVVANTLTYLSPALDPNTEYTFRVTAINGFGDGMFSPSMMVRTNFNGALL